MELKKMKRGDIYFANLDPTVGSEIKKNRPVLIVSNDANNKMASTITIVPITSNVERVYPFEVLLDTKDSQLSKTSKVQCHQIRTISKMRVGARKVGFVSKPIMSKIDYAIKVHLAIVD